MITLKKIEVSEDLFSTAVYLYFVDRREVASHLLGASAREITSSLCNGMKTDGFIGRVSKAGGHQPQSLVDSIKQFAGYLKHADRDLGKDLPDYDETLTEWILMVTAYDLKIVLKRTVVEAEFMLRWFMSAHWNSFDTKVQTEWISVQDTFPNLHLDDRATQLRRGQEVLEKARVFGNIHYLTS